MKKSPNTDDVSLRSAQSAGLGRKMGGDEANITKKLLWGTSKWLATPSDGRNIAIPPKKAQYDLIDNNSNGKSRSNSTARQINWSSKFILFGVRTPRFPGAPAEDTPKYKLPPGFKKSLELFNLDRAMKEPSDKPLVIVEGFFDCMALHQNGCRRVVALMGSTMSVAQEQLFRQHMTRGTHVIVMLDKNDAGRTGRDDVSCRLSKRCFVKVHEFDKPDVEPEHLTAEEVQTLLG